MLIRFSLTGQMCNKSLLNKINPNWEKYACNVSFLMKPGKISKIEGLNSILQMKNVVDAVLAHQEGDMLPSSAKGMLQQIMLRAFATAETESELKKLLVNIYNSIDVLDENGENLLLEGFDVNELEGELL